MPFCVACGEPLGTAAPARRGFAAMPHEPAQAVRLLSTLFPHLPRAGLDPFRGSLIAGGVIVSLLVVVGLYPLALVAAALALPLLFLMYFFTVDVYEGEPLKVMAFTLAWGAIVGLVMGFVARSIVYSTAGRVAALPPEIVVRDGIVVPLLQAALVALGPLLLLRVRAFDDVLDGATFGAVAAAMSQGVTVIVRSFDLLRSGLQPGGEAYPWIVQVALLGIAYPVLVSAVTGSVCAAFWLRFRAPVRDRRALGALGNPAIAVAAGSLLLSVAGLSRVLLGQLGGLAVVALTAVVALVWLRMVIDLGLREESATSGDGPDMRCRECGALSPTGGFCGVCGVAQRALPLERGTRVRRGTVAAGAPRAVEP